MEISFKIRELGDLESVIAREWIQFDHFGNYASSTISGLNTRKRHGLFVYQLPKSKQHLVLLSHMQEDYFDGENQHALFTVEYESRTISEGLGNQIDFQLDPIPAFIYRFGETRIKKTVVLIKDRQQLILHYEITGPVKESSRLILRPFFAFRPANECSNPERYVNTEMFEMNDNLRFLPYPESPEIYIGHTAGEFVHASMWYHNFFYRHDPENESRTEDLLNPGFFELSPYKTREIYISFGLSEIRSEELPVYYRTEKERRILAKSPRGMDSEIVSYLKERTENFKLYSTDNKYSYFITEFPRYKFNLTVHCFIARRIIRSGVDPDIARGYYQTIMSLFYDRNPLDVLTGAHPQMSVDPLSPFALIFFLYEYHSRYDHGVSVLDSIKLIQGIINHIYKNHFSFYRRTRHKLLERLYAAREYTSGEGFEKFYPDRQNFLFNVFWYNSLKILIHLAQYHDIKEARYERWVKKVQTRFLNQYMKAFLENPSQALQVYPFSFHPTMIYAISLPFMILGKAESRLLFSILVKQFMTGSGISFPIRGKEKVELLPSPLLLGEFLEGWQLVMKDKEKFLLLFQKISKNLTLSLRHEMVGYISDISRPTDKIPARRLQASALSTSEALYFFSRLEEIARNMPEAGAS